ncbi:hypothetical protein P152DRAFT_475874 [Eremomyces bilateralis CBS 781.70]|uniref:Uncharacterized protein n=1 Tax=Eremomyces bilateralis CBS 781.70 TaxID=1392243 RepID=A0A6G1FW53_9PEZI|nr:uncharacterized protein P152DRAFT_475874 [Eremomyces bilateralis CBS 781.70]KAF1810014.1 hypothetical protein P152DRAFT_475874 [Eremomyces bilateralis CBS 781.70]
MSNYGKWFDFCRDSGSARATIPVCNLFNESPTRGGDGYGGCDLNGITLSNDNYLGNLGSILFCFVAILVSFFLLWRSQMKKAAVGRREMQMFLIGYIIVSICEIFSVGFFPLDGKVRIVFSALHIAAVIASVWMLMLNGVVGYQLLEDGTPLSMGLTIVSALILFVGTGYIALDTGYSWTGYWDDTLNPPNQAYALYTLYLLAPLVFLVVFFVLETFLVLRILGERKPMLYLGAAALLFALSQIFQFVVSVHICTGSKGRINGGMFESLFVLLSVVMIWVFWSSITEDDWPIPAA